MIDDKRSALLYDIGTCPATVSSKAVLLLHASLKAQMVKLFCEVVQTKYSQRLEKATQQQIESVGKTSQTYTLYHNT